MNQRLRLIEHSLPFYYVSCWTLLARLTHRFLDVSAEEVVVYG
jgi:hypothetical protein